MIDTVAVFTDNASKMDPLITFIDRPNATGIIWRLLRVLCFPYQLIVYVFTGKLKVL